MFSSKVAEVFGFRARVPAVALAPLPLVLPRVAPLPLPRPLFALEGAKPAVLGGIGAGILVFFAVFFGRLDVREFVGLDFIFGGKVN